MPLPSQNDVKAVDRPLSNYSQAIVQSESNFVARQVFPAMPSGQRSDRFYIWNQDDFARTDARKREPSAVAPDLYYRLSTDTYRCEVWHARVPIDDQVEANADAGLNLDQGATRRVTHDLLIRQEVDWVANFFGASIWTSDETLSGADQWDDSASSPIEKVREKVYAVEAATGLRPNTAVLGSNVEKRLLDHPDIIDRIKYTSAGFADRALLARALGVERLFVLPAIRNSAAFGATASVARIAGNHALVCYVDPNPGLMSPTAGLTFTWTGFVGGGNQGFRIRRYRTEENRTDYIEGESSFDHKLVSGALGRMILSAVAS